MDSSNWKEKVTPKHMSSHREDIFLVSRISRVREKQKGGKIRAVGPKGQKNLQRGKFIVCATQAPPTVYTLLQHVRKCAMLGFLCRKGYVNGLLGEQHGNEEIDSFFDFDFPVSPVLQCMYRLGSCTTGEGRGGGRILSHTAEKKGKGREWKKKEGGRGIEVGNFVCASDVASASLLSSSSPSPFSSSPTTKIRVWKSPNGS